MHQQKTPPYQDVMMVLFRLPPISLAENYYCSSSSKRPTNCIFCGIQRMDEFPQFLTDLKQILDTQQNRASADLSMKLKLHDFGFGDWLDERTVCRGSQNVCKKSLR